ncbi:lipolytic protein G-D-S-L family [Pedobacter sp. HDW13]|uniref:GDSL-type esterase/lipase family protein n=1 Tax=unclassified Pedobacter TaxID=2628915 RepID=UPI000F59482C|nr:MULTISPECIES: GDSL-type esterase/lipase family protein [unclassified Pedobacter]QIL42205.1 lipolytic protein G-D-S-L family [Pedobacter sp. HDW13]RQO76556.1 lipolytic protein G-D-S-L family [Pedobacter sp. KBW01]
MKKILTCLALLLFSASFLYAQSEKRNLNIVFIGNSITQGVQLANVVEAPPANAVAYLLKQKGIGEVNFSNQGHSGYTTFDFLPAETRTFTKIEEAASAFTDKEALLIFSVKLGTNDSAIQGPHGSPVSAERYIENVKIIVDKLLAGFPKAVVVLQHPIWYSPNTYNSSKYLQEGLSRLQSYIPKIDSLAKSYQLTNPKHVFVGDKKAFTYFKKHHLTELIPEKGQAGTFYLHPNKLGAASLGRFWANAIGNIVRKNF